MFRLCTETDDVEADISASLDTVGVNDPLLFNTRSSRLEDLVGEMEENAEILPVESVISFGLNASVGVSGRRGEVPERNSSISEAEWARGSRLTADSSRKVPCPVKKQNLKEGSEEMVSPQLKNKIKRTCR